MNVTVENLAPCKKLMRVEVDAKAVDEAFDSMTKDFQKQARCPASGPARRRVISCSRNTRRTSQDEVKRKLIGDSYRKAVEEKKLDVLGYPDIEEIQFGRGQPLLFAATIETCAGISIARIQGPAGQARGQSCD